MAAFIKKPLKFFNEVKAETRKVVWSSFKQTRMMTLMVFVMVVLIAIFLSVADLALGGLIRSILSMSL